MGDQAAPAVGSLRTRAVVGRTCTSAGAGAEARGPKLRLGGLAFSALAGSLLVLLARPHPRLWEIALDSPEGLLLASLGCRAGVMVVVVGGIVKGPQKVPRGHNRWEPATPFRPREANLKRPRW